MDGIKLTREEDKTQYEAECGVEVYEHLRTRLGVTAWNPLSIGVTYVLPGQVTTDKVSLPTINHSHTDATDGRVFKYIFLLLLNPYSGTSGIVDCTGNEEGGIDKSEGEKIVVFYHGSPYGKGTIPVCELLTKKYDFTVQQTEVPHLDNEQQSQWLAIRRTKPDHVALHGRDVVNPVALEMTQKTGFPANHIIGNVRSDSEEDVIPAGDAVKGYIAITMVVAGVQYPVIQQIAETLCGHGKGSLQDKKRVGSIYHSLGVLNDILSIEAICIAQARFSKRMLTGDEVHWGLENLKIDETRVVVLGVKGPLHSIDVTQDNHEGDGHVAFQQWDGTK